MLKEKLNFRDYLSLLTIGFHITTTIVGVAFFCVIKFNDLAHLEGRLDEIKINLSCVLEQVNNFNGRLSKIEGYIEGKDK